MTAPKRGPGRPAQPGGPKVQIRPSLSMEALDMLAAWAEGKGLTGEAIGRQIEALIRENAKTQSAQPPRKRYLGFRDGS